MERDATAGRAELRSGRFPLPLERGRRESTSFVNERHSGPPTARSRCASGDRLVLMLGRNVGMYTRLALWRVESNGVTARASASKTCHRRAVTPLPGKGVNSTNPRSDATFVASTSNARNSRTAGRDRAVAVTSLDVLGAEDAAVSDEGSPKPPRRIPIRSGREQPHDANGDGEFTTAWTSSAGSAPAGTWPGNSGTS